jgi:hypothetical protein
MKDNLTVLGNMIIHIVHVNLRYEALYVDVLLYVHFFDINTAILIVTEVLIDLT